MTVKIVAVQFSETSANIYQTSQPSQKIKCMCLLKEIGQTHIYELHAPDLLCLQILNPKNVSECSNIIYAEMFNFIFSQIVEH
jgi:hypothetical protein